MTPLFAIPLFLGVAGLLGWIAATALARDHGGPEARFGSTGRSVIAGLLGFGLAGIAALYAGWPGWSAVVVGVAGAAGLAAVARFLGPEPT